MSSNAAAQKTRGYGRNAKTLDILLMMILVIGVVSISSSIVSEAFEDTRVLTAKLDLEHLAANLAETQANTRGPASSLRINMIAEISKDPWGNPYHYQILKPDSGDIKVLVWSAGPNGKFESDSKLAEGRIQGFTADDLGFVYDPKSAKRK